MKKNLLTFICSFSLSIALAQQGEWTWMKGDSTTGFAGAFGTLGVEAVSNKPPGMYEAAEWRDHSGNFWMFGGLMGNYAEMGALWKFNPVTNNWTWMKGPNTVQQPGVYGVQGVAAPNNHPGCRSWGVATWVDTTGHLWLFGGYGYDASGTHGFLNDLWMYDIATNNWTWVNGPNAVGDPGLYGIIGVPAPSNLPPCRYETNGSWTDLNNNLWLFGGYMGNGVFNDMWRYNPSTNLWTWMKGSNLPNSAGSYGSIGIEDPSNEVPARMVYSKWTDHDGNLWLFGGVSGFGFNDMWRFNILTNNWTWMSGPNSTNQIAIADTLCSSQTTNRPGARFENRACWTDSCDIFWEFGGTDDNVSSDRTNDLWRFNAQSLEWTWVNGSITSSQSGFYGQQTISNSSNHPSARSGAISWIDLNGNLWLFGGTLNFLNPLNDLWRYIPDHSCGNFITSCGGSAPSSSLQASDTSFCVNDCIDFTDFSINNPTSWSWQFSGAVTTSSTNQNPSQICYTTPGDYDVSLTATNQFGSNTTTLPLYIHVHANPPAPTITQNGNTLTSSPAAIYQWSINGYPVVGATNQSFSTTLPCLITITITDAFGCTSHTNLDFHPTGIENMSNELSLAIYPNPNNGIFHVDISGVSSSTTIRVVNAIGQIIFLKEEKYSSNELKEEIDLSDVASGIYFIEIKSAGDHFIQKLDIVK